MISAAIDGPELAKYELLEEIGHGGMATVYRANDRRLGREVAVKVIHRHLRENPEVATRFDGEARAVAKLRHRNIVDVYDVSEEGDEERYLVVELVRGPTLRQQLRKHGRMPTEVAAGLALELAAALEHAHDEGVVHRDIKPENVLIELPDTPSSKDSSERHRDATLAKIKLTDFGIAKLLDAGGVTSTGQVLGSPAHMAPEQIEGGNVDGRADVFGLGVLTYEAMVGHLPFEGRNPAQVLRRVLDGKYPPADRECPSVGSRWAGILAKALANDPDDRYASIGDFAADVHAELDAMGVEQHREEVTAYLLEPETYASGWEERAVKRLVERGERARASGAVAEAAGHFNRALAYRPNDPDLVAKVTGLAKRERLLRNAKRGGVVAAIALLGAAGAYGVAKLMQSPEITPVAARDTNDPSRDFEPSRALPVVTAEPTASPPVESSAPKKGSMPSLKPVGVVTAPTSDEGSGETRQVMVTVSGYQDTAVTVDGAPVNNLLEARWTFEVGSTHTFTFTPKHDTCCKAVTKRVTIPKGAKDGDEYLVQGVIRYKHATLVFHAPKGTITCANQGPFTDGQSWSVPMNDLEQEVTCNFTPADSSPQRTKKAKVTAGQSATLSF